MEKYMSNNNEGCCGKDNCCTGSDPRPIYKTKIQTADGEMEVLSYHPLDAAHLQEKIDNAAKIEENGTGQYTKYEHEFADNALKSYKLIIAKRKPSFWNWLKSLFTRKRPKSSPKLVKRRT